MLSRKEIRSLLNALLAKSTQYSENADLTNFFCRQLGGGYSGSFVALVWLDDLPTLILKAGPSEGILGETEARRRFESPALEAIRKLGLSDCSDPVEIEVEGHDELWRAMAYTYVGSLSYEDMSSFSDFQAIFDDFISPQRDEWRPSALALRDWLRFLCGQVASREIRHGDGAKRQGIRAKPLSEFLPRLPWRHGLTAVIESAAAYAPQASDLLGLHEWWEEAVARQSLAAFPNTSLLHGDLRFANVLVNRTTADVELIDFGNSAEGHVFRDLARFECDLLFRVVPPPAETKTLRLSSEDRRMRALERAFDPQAHMIYDPDDPESPQIAALKILRETYDSYWHVSSDEGRRRMYMWFLLAETLKRLMWTGDVFSTLTGRRALLCSVVMLKRAVSDQQIGVPEISSVSGISRLLSCTALYVPSRGYEATVNRERNSAKIKALQRAGRQGATVKLLAETGNSFLHFRGPFYPEVEGLLESGCLQVVLANPNFVESHGISVAYKDPSSLDAFRIHPLLKQKFSESFQGYETLRAQAGPRLQVRIARYGIGATLLATDDEIFFEPYFRSDRSRRHRRLFETFELRFSARNDHVRDLFDEHFSFFWNNSDPLETGSGLSSLYSPLLADITAIWEGSSE